MLCNKTIPSNATVRHSSEKLAFKFQIMFFVNSENENDYIGTFARCPVLSSTQKNNGFNFILISTLPLRSFGEFNSLSTLIQFLEKPLFYLILVNQHPL